METASLRVRELIEAGKTKGVLTYKEIVEQLVELDLDADQVDKVLDTLENMGSEVINEDKNETELAHEPVIASEGDGLDL